MLRCFEERQRDRDLSLCLHIQGGRAAERERERDREVSPPPFTLAKDRDRERRTYCHPGECSGFTGAWLLVCIQAYRDIQTYYMCICKRNRLPSPDGFS